MVAILLPRDFIRRRLAPDQVPAEAYDAAAQQGATPEKPVTGVGRWAAYFRRHPVLRISLLVLKNAAGVLLAIAGLAMLVLPGQGVLTLIVALLLLDIPGKQKFEAKLLSRPRLLRMLNRLRTRYGRPTLEMPTEEASPHGGSSAPPEPRP